MLTRVGAEKRVVSVAWDFQEVVLEVELSSKELGGAQTGLARWIELGLRTEGSHLPFWSRACMYLGCRHIPNRGGRVQEAAD